ALTGPCAFVRLDASRRAGVPRAERAFAAARITRALARANASNSPRRARFRGYHVRGSRYDRESRLFVPAPPRRIVMFLSRSQLSRVLCVLALGALAAAQEQRLNGPLARPVGGDIRSFVFSPNGARLVYTADQDVDERVDLYSVLATNPTPVRLGAP